MLESARVDSLNLSSTIKQRNFSAELDSNAKTNIFDFTDYNGKDVASPLKLKFVEQIPSHVFLFLFHT